MKENAWYEFVSLNYLYLKYSDDSPKQGIKVLSVRNCIPCLCLQTELTAKYMHPQDTAAKQDFLDTIEYAQNMLFLKGSLLMTTSSMLVQADI